MAARKRKTHKARKHTTKRRTKRHVKHSTGVKAEIGHVIKTLQKVKKAV